jgi:hypothetical protein
MKFSSSYLIQKDCVFLLMDFPFEMRGLPGFLDVRQIAGISLKVPENLREIPIENLRNLIVTFHLIYLNFE